MQLLGLDHVWAMTAVQTHRLVRDVKQRHPIGLVRLRHGAIVWIAEEASRTQW